MRHRNGRKWSIQCYKHTGCKNIKQNRRNKKLQQKFVHLFIYTKENELMVRLNILVSMKTLSLFAYNCLPGAIQSPLRILTFSKRVLHPIHLASQHSPQVFQFQKEMYVRSIGIKGRFSCNVYQSTNKLRVDIETLAHFPIQNVIELVDEFFQPHRVELH